MLMASQGQQSLRDPAHSYGVAMKHLEIVTKISVYFATIGFREKELRAR